MGKITLKPTVVENTTEDLDSFIFETDKQRRLYHELLADGFVLADDPAGLEEHIGSVREIECHCQLWTPRLLCKLYVKGTENIEHSFHLVPLHQIVKWQYLVPQPNSTFTAKFIIGVRRVSDNQFVPALRLPLK